MFGRKKKQPLDVISLDSEKVENAVQWIEDFRGMLEEKNGELELLEPSLEEKRDQYNTLILRVHKAREHIGKLLSLFES